MKWQTMIDCKTKQTDVLICKNNVKEVQKLFIR